MKTDDFLSALAADETPPAPAPGRALLIALAAALIVTAVLFFTAMGTRDDFMTAMGTVRFDFKLVVTLTLAFTGIAVAVRLSQPQPLARGETVLLIVAPALLILAVIAEMIAMPMATWMPRAMGHNRMLCMRYIPLLSLIPHGADAVGAAHGGAVQPLARGRRGGADRRRHRRGLLRRRLHRRFAAFCGTLVHARHRRHGPSGRRGGVAASALVAPGARG